MSKKKPQVTLFLTRNMSLKEWDRLGLLHREMAIYKALMPDYSIQIFSWGDVGDLNYEKVFEDLRVLILPYYKQYSTFRNLIHQFLAEKRLKSSDLFKTNQISGSEVAIEYSQKFGIPLITRCGYLLSLFTERQSSSDWEKQKAVALERTAFEMSRFGVTSSERDRLTVIQKHQIPHEKLVTIPNYVDTRLFKPNNLDKEKGAILHIGRLSEQKNLFALLEAYESAKYARKLTIVGSGELEKELKEHADSNCSKEVCFLGKVPNSELPGIINKHEVYVLSSHYEGLPKSLLEAMSCGAACLGTDVEGICEVLDHKINGLLVEKTIGHIAEGIDLLLSNQQLRREIGTAARNTILEEYSLDTVVKMEKELYRKILGHK